MHTMIKRALFFLVCAIITGALGFSNVVPNFNQTFQGFSLLFVVLVMFFSISYSLREEDLKT